MHVLRLTLIAGLATALSGCFVLEQRLFPVWEENFFEESPAEVGPFAALERRVDVPDGADGQPFGITVFEPADAEGPLPVFVWVMGSNVQAYYHQSLHETLASWGYLVLVPDTRPLRFADFQYHNRLVLLAEQTIGLALAGSLGVQADPGRIAAGGYSVGGPLAAFTAARTPSVGALVYWAPSGAPFWQGLSPDGLYPNVTQPALYILGDRDDDAPVEGGYPSTMQGAMPGSAFDRVIIQGATHHQFQQPTGADGFSNTPGITREEQQGIAIDETRAWLDTVFGIER